MGGASYDDGLVCKTGLPRDAPPPRDVIDMNGVSELLLSRLGASVRVVILGSRRRCWMLKSEWGASNDAPLQSLSLSLSCGLDGPRWEIEFGVCGFHFITLSARLATILYATPTNTF